MELLPEDKKCIIETKTGPICGFIETVEEKSYYKFLGIPYAKPPLGRLRFLPPQPIDPWTNLKDCTKKTEKSLSYDIEDKLSGSEDCLYLEISTPNIRPDKPLPVMFWIGCLGFEFDMDYLHDPSLLNDEGILFARCNFRLGPFGFLSNHDITAPGNCGLKDLVMALKWIQKNIRTLGGDPDNVTIFGNSTGAALVHLMMMSPMTIGLFHKAIIQSATALNNWSLDKNPAISVLDIGEHLGIKKKCKLEIVEQLKSLPARRIMEAFLEMENQVTLKNRFRVIDAKFKPCVEIEFEGQPAFLTKSPITLLKSGNFHKVPLIIGSNNIEGEILQYIRDDFYNDFQTYNEDVRLLVPKALARDSKLSAKIGYQLLKFYVGEDKKLTEDTKSQYLQIISDYYFSYYVNKTVRLHSQFAPNCPVYYYIINYAGEWKVPDHLKFFNSMGHSSEIPFIFQIKVPGLPIIKGSRDSLNTRSRVVKMWTNFSKYGNPTPHENDEILQIKWDPVESPDRLNYLSIGPELTKGVNPFQDRMKFWDDLHKEHTFIRAQVYFSDIGVTW